MQALDGKNVVLQAPTASGKTLAFLIPMLEALCKPGTHALMIYPTKALALDQRDQLSRLPQAALPLLQLAALQTQSAGATLCAAFDERGALQSSLIAAELSLKAALTAADAEESELKGARTRFSKAG